MAASHILPLLQVIHWHKKRDLARSQKTGCAEALRPVSREVSRWYYVTAPGQGSGPQRWTIPRHCFLFGYSLLVNGIKYGEWTDSKLIPYDYLETCMFRPSRHCELLTTGPGYLPLDRSIDDWPYQLSGLSTHSGPGYSLTSPA